MSTRERLSNARGEDAASQPRFGKKVVLITGGAYGIGRVYGRAFAAEGAAIVIADIDGERTKATAAELEADGHQALGVQCDVADEPAVRAAVEEGTDRFGGIDILINNAGVHLIGGVRILDMPRDDWRRAWEVNVTGAINCTAAVRPSMRERGGGVVANQLSTAAFRPGGGPYTITKLASRALVAAFGKELAPDNIRAVGIAPGLVDSEAAMSVLPPERIQSVIDGQLIKRLGRMEELANALLFLCSDAASFVTGDSLIVGGGADLRF
jgi:3-oxoacyl-[acyl-carrier protein] reductase